MKTKTIITVTLAFLLMGLANVPSTAAQLAPKQEEVQPKPSESYKVDFTVSELDNGKKINSRSYSMLIRAEATSKWTSGEELRLGSKVPVTVGTIGNSLQYLDLGMNIDCRLMPMGNGKVALGTKWEYSSAGNQQEREMGHPVIQHVSSDVEAIVPLGKSTVISEMDDVASTHHYVFEVKVTKISE